MSKTPQTEQIEDEPIPEGYNQCNWRVQRFRALCYSLESQLSALQAELQGCRDFPAHREKDTAPVSAVKD